MSNRFARQAALGLLLLCGFGAAQAQVVISQVYGGGGNSGATLRSDFIELHNNGVTAVSINGWSVQYASATGTTWQATALSGSIPAGGYYLVKQADGSGGTVDLPTPDATGTISMSGSNGKVALVAATTLLSGACPAGLVDQVGYGSANCFEGSAAAPALSSTTAALRAGDGCTDSNDNGADFASGTPTPRNSASAIVGCGGSGTPQLSIGDASIGEGDNGTKPLFFTISLNQPAGTGGASVEYATQDATATAGSDYVARTGTATIAEGASSVTIHVDVLGDGIVETDETFEVNLGNATGAGIADAQGIGTIANDDFALVAIHAIQGDGATSPLEGQQVATQGIVTARKSNGYFLQAADVEVDGDDATSEGLFVFTAGAPPAEAAVGNRVTVQGTVVEFVPSADPNQLPLTELSFATTFLVSTGNPLPTPAALTVDSARPDGDLGQLERYEGMRVTAPSFTVVAPTRGFTSEANATGTSNGEFAVVVSGVPRPFREPGIPVLDPLPSGTTATSIPHWDYNPELIAVDSDRIGAPVADLAAGCRVVNNSLTGPLDYTFRRYTIYPEAALESDCSTALPRPALLPGADHATFATYNLERFFDTVNDPAIGEPVLTPAAFDVRLRKASLAIRNFLHAPDILGAVEVENLSTLQALADRINFDAANNGQPNPLYEAYLVEGNDVGGIDVGLLVKTAEVRPGVPRVEVLDVAQQGKDATWVFPGTGATSLLNDRPPLLLDGVVHFADGRRLPVTTIVVHQRSLGGVDSEDPAGTSTNGDRVRQKRQQQAEFLAGTVDGLQDADPQRNIVVLGDFNAFEFNDGHADTMGTTTGLPSPDDATAVPGDGIDLVEPDLFNASFAAPPSERYSFVFDSNAQSLDHILVNNGILLSPQVNSFTLSHARINADFPLVARNDADSPSRLSDHDPTVLLLRLNALQFSDLSTEVMSADARVAVGATLGYGVTVANAGPDAASFPGVGFALDAEVADMAVDAPTGWTCDTPTVGNGTSTLACTSALLADAASADFVVTATAPASAAGGTVALTAAATSQTEDPVPGNDSDSDAIAVEARADLSAALAGPDRIARPGSADYVALVRNLGASTATQPVVVLVAGVPSDNVNVVAPAGWQCIRQPVRTYRAECRPDGGSLPAGADASFGLTVSTAGKQILPWFPVRVGVASPVVDTNAGNNADAIIVSVAR